MKKMNKNICSLICDLVTLNGNISVISKIKGLLSKSYFRLNHNLKNLEFISSKIIILPNVFDVQIDLCNLNTLNYQKDIIYSAYIQNIRKEIAKGGRYDELVKYFNPKEASPNGIVFSISIDNLRKLVLTEEDNNKKILIVYKDKDLLSKAIDEQKKLHSVNVISILELNPCENIDEARKLMSENGCNDILWIN